MPDEREPSDAVQTLQRWQDAGAVWRVIGRTPGTVTVGLYQCTGGEEMDRFVSTDSALIRFIGDRKSSED